MNSTAQPQAHDGAGRPDADAVRQASTNPLDQLNRGQLDALSRFREEAGPRWKSRLLAGWIRAAYPGHLQAIRNQLGPEWLATVKDDHFRQSQMRVERGPDPESAPAKVSRQRM